MRKKIFGIFIIIIVCLTCLSVQGETIYDNSRKDWWSMENHDVNNTGFSTATAPDYDNLFWINNTIGGTYMGSPTVVNGCVYVGSEDNNLYCFHAQTGQLIWKFPTISFVRKTPAVWMDRVYFGTDEGYNGVVYCLDANTGQFIWNYTINDGMFNMVTSSPTIANGNLYIGSFNGNEYCLDALTGDFKWMYPTNGYVYSTAAVADGKIYFGSYDGFLYCLDAQTGGFLWKFDSSVNGGGELTMERQITSAPTIYQDTVIFSTADGLVFCLNTSLQGVEKWRCQAGNGGEKAHATIAYNRVYVNSYIVEMEEPHQMFAKVYCLNLTTGKELWVYTVNPGNYWGQQAYGCSVADYKVYFGISNTYYEPDFVFCLDAFQGKALWSYEVSDDIRSTPAIADNRLYITSRDGKIYCFQDEGEQQPNQQPYPATNPMPQNNSRNVDINTSLSWTAEDPDEEPLTFDVYFGETSSLQKVSLNQMERSYKPPTILEYGTTYYWRIVTWDYHNASTTSDTWSFATQSEPTPPTIEITKPKVGYLYLNDKEIMKRIIFDTTLIFGKITIEVNASDINSGINRVDFFIDDTLKETVNTTPYCWLWTEISFPLEPRTIKVVAYDNEGNSTTDEIFVKKFF